MTAKIDRTEPTRLARLDGATRAREPERTPDRRTAEGHVAITHAAHHIAQLEKRIAASSGIDAGKVAMVSDAIARGRYEVDATKVADGFLRSDLQLRTAAGAS